MLSPEDRARIADAIREAEARTSGEIVCTLSVERHRYVAWVLALAAVIAFLLPALLVAAGFGPARAMALLGFWQAASLTERQAILLYAAAQAVVLILATLALWWSPFAQRWVPLSLREDRVHDIASRQFLMIGVHETEGRTGVLIHASMEDHVVEVIADKAIYEKVPPEHWGETAAALLAGMARNDPAGGYVAAIALAGAVLAEHFPPSSDNPNELPNHLLLI